MAKQKNWQMAADEMIDESADSTENGLADGSAEESAGGATDEMVC